MTYNPICLSHHAREMLVLLVPLQDPIGQEFSLRLVANEYLQRVYLISSLFQERGHYDQTW